MRIYTLCLYGPNTPSHIPVFPPATKKPSSIRERAMGKEEGEKGRKKERKKEGGIIMRKKENTASVSC